MNAVNTVLLLFVVLFIWYFSELPRLYREARKTKLPVYVSPISSSSPVWLVLSSLLGYSFIERITPAPLFEVIKYNIVGHEARLKYYGEGKHGKTFAHVTPSEVTIFSSDVELATELLSRTTDFLATEGAARKYFGLLRSFCDTLR